MKQIYFIHVCTQSVYIQVTFDSSTDGPFLNYHVLNTLA